MHILIVDTNVIVSSLLGKSYPFLIVRDLILKEKVACVVSESVLEEYRQTLFSIKFMKVPLFSSESMELLKDIQSVSIPFESKIQLNVLKDPDDNKFLELAVECKANFLVTGNSKHFPFGEFMGTEIISPGNYWRKFWC